MIRQTHQTMPKKLAHDFIFKDECYAIVGACFEVYKDKGCGFTNPCIRNVSALNSSIAAYPQSPNQDCRSSIERGFSAKNISLIFSATRK